jgi:RNA polymerase sigma-70 factor (ECF subfamily)
MVGIDIKRLREGALAGGKSAGEVFTAFWNEWYRRLYAFAASYRGMPAGERHDAVSDALIAAYCALGTYDASRPLSPWVYRIAANHFSDMVRRGARVSDVPVGAVPEDGRDGGAGVHEPVSPDDHAELTVRRDLAERCRCAIDKLPEGDRRIAMLRFYEHLRAAEIGRVLGMPAGTVRWRVGRIRARLKAAVGED